MSRSGASRERKKCRVPRCLCALQCTSIKEPIWEMFLGAGGSLVTQTPPCVIPLLLLFFFKFYSYFIYLFIYFWLCWVLGSCEGFLRLRQAGATPHRGAGTALHRGARASHHRGPPRRGAQAPDAQAQQPWPTGPAAPWHAGSSQTRARTRVPRTSRQTLNHCATREALEDILSTFLL